MRRSCWHCTLISRPSQSFRFESIWVQFDGFEDVVKHAWASTIPNADACRLLDHKFRETAAAIKRWSAQRVHSIRLELAAATVVIVKLDKAQGFSALSDGEIELRRDLKCNVLGLASMSRMIAHQRSRL
jgi:hypothetical protein